MSLVCCDHHSDHVSFLSSRPILSQEYAEIFVHFGFASVEDLLNPELVRDDDLVTHCGMSEEEVRGVDMKGTGVGAVS
jgi:hypothetical protein